MKNKNQNDRNRYHIYRLICSIIIIGAIIPFAAQFILPFFFPDKSVAGAEIWNQYVSIILGVVATITSIVSLVLGFKSEQQSYETELRTRDMLQRIETRVQLVSQKQDQMLQNSLSVNYNESAKSVSANLADGKNVVDDELIN